MKNNWTAYIRWAGNSNITRYELEEESASTTSDFKFLVSPFAGKSMVFSVVDQSECNELEDCKLFFDHDFSPSKSKVEYLKMVQKMVDLLKSAEVSKVVCARNQKIKCHHRVKDWFSLLSSNYPNAHVYFFNHPKTGAWMGATPETLLETKRDQIKTMSLAGTKVSEDSSKWGEKEVEEQKFVTDYILEILNNNSVVEIETSMVFEKKAGPVKHLCTEITGRMSDSQKIMDIVSNLHPTPAVCGVPKEEALGVLKELEGLNRKLYSGYLGFVSSETSHLLVNLRCLQLVEDGVVLYAGGGLTKDSDPESEWRETVNKMQTLQGALHI